MTANKPLWERIIFTSDDEKQKFSKLRSYARTFKLVKVRKRDILSAEFLRFRLKNSSMDFRKQTRIIERIVKVNNQLSTTHLPEIVDVFSKEKNGKMKIYIVKEFVDGAFSTANLHEYITSGYLRVGANKDKNSDDNYELLLNKSLDSKQRFIQVNKFIDRVLMEIIDFQEHLLSNGLVHIGILPEHIGVGIDLILKFFGERYIVRETNGYIDDRAILDDAYGSIIIPRYTPKELLDYVSLNGSIRAKALSIISYQLAVLLFDAVTECTYANQDFDEKTLENAVLLAPSKIRNALRETIRTLASEEFRNGLKSMDDIRNVLIKYHETVGNKMIPQTYIREVGKNMEKRYISKDLFENLFDSVLEEGTTQQQLNQQVEIKVYVKKYVVLQKSFSCDVIVIGRSSGSFEPDVDLGAYLPDKVVSKQTLMIERFEGKYYVKSLSDIPVYCQESKTAPAKLIPKGEYLQINGSIRLIIKPRSILAKPIGLEIQVKQQ